MPLGRCLFFTVVLILAQGFFALSKVALENANIPTLRKEAARGDKRAQRVLDLVHGSVRLLPGMQVTVLVFGLSVTAFAVLNLSQPLASFLVSWAPDWLDKQSSWFAPLLVGLLVVYFDIVFGQALPARIGRASATKLAKSVVHVAVPLQSLVVPFALLVNGTVEGVSRLFRIRDAGQSKSLSEEDIKDLVSVNKELPDGEKRMIRDILDLGEMRVREVMQPRVDMIFAEDNETVRQVADRMAGTGYTRLPVFHEDIDNVVGIVHYKDLVNPLSDGRGDSLVAPWVYKALFVPETKNVYPLLDEMQTNRQQMAIVVDEYGGTGGLITLEDIVEEIVGEIVDESDHERPFMQENGEGVWTLDGRFAVEDALELGWPVDDSDDYETIAGWLMDKLDSVPQPGDELLIEGYLFRILNMRRRRIRTVRVQRLEKKDSSSVGEIMV